MMKLKTTGSLAAAALLTLAAFLFAQMASAETKIGVVDFKKLLVEAPALKTALDAFMKELGPRREELIRMQSAVKAHPNNEQLRRDFTAQTSEFLNRGRAGREDVVKKVENSIKEAIGVYARSQDIDLVIGGAPVLVDPDLRATTQTLDITTKIQAYMAKPATQPVAESDPSPTPPPVHIGLVRGLSPETRASANIPRLQRYASEQGYALVVLDELLYWKPQFKVADITTDVYVEMQSY